MQSPPIVSRLGGVSRCDASPVLQLAEDAFDDVSALLGGAIKLVWGPLGGRGGTVPVFLCVSQAAQTVGVVGLVRQQAVWFCDGREAERS